MKRTLTAVIALATAAGFAGLVQAQTTSTTTTPSSTAPSTYSTAPSATAPSAAAPSATAPSTTSAANPSPAPQAGMQQPASGNSFWSRNISEDEVRQAQQQLQAQGLYKGPIDGKVGSEMHRALARYQQQNGLRQTGTLDEQTVARIGGGAGPAIGSTTPPAGSAAAPAGSGSMTGGAATGGTAASPSTTSPIGAGGTSPTTSTTAPSTSSTQPVTR
jgi:peptidoglycan hydrolase-like protein with peptidoglycan-binding domain